MLLLEDDPAHAEPLIYALGRDGYTASGAASGAEGLELLRGASPPEVLITNRGLPDMDGSEVIRQGRSGGFWGAIIVLSGRRTEVDVVQCLDLGADDYVVKPYGFAELSARIRAVLRRGTPTVGPEGRVEVDVQAHRATCNGIDIPLSQKEFALLTELMASEGSVVTRDHLLRVVWGGTWYGSPKTLNVAIGRLREKFRQTGVRCQIVAVRGVGFRYDAAA